MCEGTDEIADKFDHVNGFVHERPNRDQYTDIKSIENNLKNFHPIISIDLMNHTILIQLCIICQC